MTTGGWPVRRSRGAGPQGGPQGRAAEIVGVGDVRMVRTFRIGPDGELLPVNSAVAWTDGWNTAACGRGRSHTPPDPDCRCGFYVYSDPAYVLAQPPGWQVIAAVSVNGPMEAGSRGARVHHARVEAVWLGPRVRAKLVEAVQRRYPSVRVFRDRAAMDETFPLTQIGGFSPPHVGERARRRLRPLMWSFLSAVTALGCVSTQTVLTTYVGAVVWLTLLAAGVGIVLAGLVQRSPVVGLQGLAAVGWLLTAGPRTPGQWVMRAVLVVLMASVVLIWWRAGQPGRRPRTRRHWRGWLPGSR